MWLWWVQIPTKEFTDVTLASEDTDNYDDHEYHDDQFDHDDHDDYRKII